MQAYYYYLHMERSFRLILIVDGMMHRLNEMRLIQTPRDVDERQTLSPPLGVF